jgi:hypothetical protein
VRVDIVPPAGDDARGRTLTQRQRERLALAAVEEWLETAADEGDTRFFDLFTAIGETPAGTELPTEIPNGTDGTTNLERVALALDYYGI